MTDLPLTKAAKLWARVLARTEATHLTGRWGACQVLMFEYLECASDAEASHFLLLGEAGEWPGQERLELRTVPAAPVEGSAGEKPTRRRGKTRGNGAASRRERPGSGVRAGTARCTVGRRAAEPAEVKDGPLIEDPPDDLRRE